MFRLSGLIMLALAMVPDVSAGQLLAPVWDPPHKIEGDLMEVGDKLFWLHAIDALEKAQICEGESRPYDFGLAATTGLMDLTAGVAQVMCCPKKSVRNGAVIAKF